MIDIKCAYNKKDKKLEINCKKNLLLKEDFELFDSFWEALATLYKNDYYLIENQVHERAIVFRFGLYFYKFLKKTEYSNLDLDFEYNRNYSDKKRLKDFEDGTYPDLILHKRGSNKDNLLVIEFKTWWNNDERKDIKKIEGFLDNNDCYKYKYGISILLNKENCKLKCLRRNER